MTVDQLMERVPALDVEVTKTGAHVRHIGAAYQGSPFEWTGWKTVHRAFSGLNAFGRDTKFVLAHNIFSHDLPLLKGVAPWA